MKSRMMVLVVLTVSLLLAACGQRELVSMQGDAGAAATPRATVAARPAAPAAWVSPVAAGAAQPTAGAAAQPLAGTTEGAASASAASDTAAQPTEAASFTLETVTENGFAFKGMGGEGDGVLNPELKAQAGSEVTINVVNGDGVQHDLTIDAFNVKTPPFMGKGSAEAITFVADKAGSFEYYCSIPGHKQAGMVGTLVIEGEVSGQAQTEGSGNPYVQDAPGDVAHPAAIKGAPILAADPNVLPGPLAARGPQTIQLTMEVQERIGQLADGTTPILYTYRCTGCGLCVAACPTGALQVLAGRVVLAAEEACTYCTRCEDSCPVGAIALPFKVLFAEDLPRFLAPCPA